MAAASGSEVEQFTPPSLKDIAAPPTFVLRPATGRSLRLYNHAIRSEGLEYHPVSEFRNEMLTALKSLWSADHYAVHEPRLIAQWAAIDAHNDAVAKWKANGAKGDEPAIDIPEGEAEALNELQGRLARSWPKLSQMTADNMRFGEDAMKIAAAMAIGGWIGIDLPFNREDGKVPLETIDDLEVALRTMEEQAREAHVTSVGYPGTAFLELVSKCSSQLNLTRDEEKNSPSPSPASSDLNGSTTSSSVPTAGVSSKASARSKKTPRGK